jgi:O-antigen/teichoic acid export membrane protein
LTSSLRATAILGSGSIVSIAVGLIATKALASLLGPSGIGLIGLLQSLVGMVTLVAGLGIGGAALVREGAAAIANEDEAWLAALRSAAWSLVWLPGGLGALGLVVFRDPLSRWAMGTPHQADNVALMGAALLFGLATSIQTGWLNAHHRVAALARSASIGSILTAAVMICCVWFLGVQGVGYGIVAGAAANWAVSRYFYAHELRLPSRVAALDLRRAAASLLRFGVPYTGSMVIGTSVQLALPVLVLHQLGQDSVGFYRAATTVSITYLGFLLNAMSQDYFPRVSAVHADPAALNYLANQQLRLVMLLITPMVLGVLALAPFLIPIVYTPAFRPTVQILEWQLIGDIVKLSSRPLAYVLLAHSGSGRYFISELSGGVLILATSWFGMQWFGLPGLGLAVPVTYAVYYLVASGLLRRTVRLTWSLENRLLMAGALVASLTTRLLPMVGLGQLRTPVALTLAAIAACGSALLLWREIGRPVPTWPARLGSRT